MIFTDAALNQLRAEGCDHINMLGRYAFILLRPLRDPQNTDDEG